MNILIIDDHNILLDGLKRVLMEMDDISEVFTLNNAEVALDYLARHQDIDLVLIDLGMPVMNGLSFIHGLNARNIIIPAVILSATENLHEVRQALDAGAVGYIPKHYNTEQMQNAIQDILTYGEFIPASIKSTFMDMEKKRDAGSLQNYGLSRRQIAVLELIAQGHTNHTIATTLNISENTVKSHLKIIFDALQVSNRTESVARAKQLGLINV